MLNPINGDLIASNLIVYGEKTILYTDIYTTEQLNIENKEYKSIDFSVTKIHKGEYDHCRFINCNFENSHISKFEFVCILPTYFISNKIMT